MKISFSNLACADSSIDEVIDFAKKFNYDGVELRTPKDKEERKVKFSEKEVEVIKEKFSKAGVELICVSGYTRFDTREQLEEQVTDLKYMIKLTSALGAPYLRSFGGQVDLIKEAFGQVSDLAEECGVQVLLETHDVLSKGEDVAKVFENLDSEYFGVIWDVKHTLKAGEGVEQTKEYIGEYIKHVHIKDWIEPDFKENDHLVLLGSGILDMDGALKVLNELGYDGYLSVEWEKLWMPDIEEADIALYQYANKLREILK